MNVYDGVVDSRTLHRRRGTRAGQDSSEADGFSKSLMTETAKAMWVEDFYRQTGCADG